MPPTPKPTIVSVYGQRRVAARDAELRLHRRQHDDDRPHADAADGRQQQRHAEPQPRVARVDDAVRVARAFRSMTAVVRVSSWENRARVRPDVQSTASSMNLPRRTGRAAPVADEDRTFRRRDESPAKRNIRHRADGTSPIRLPPPRAPAPPPCRRIPRAASTFCVPRPSPDCRTASPCASGDSGMPARISSRPSSIAAESARTRVRCASRLTIGTYVNAPGRSAAMAAIVSWYVSSSPWRTAWTSTAPRNATRAGRCAASTGTARRPPVDRHQSTSAGGTSPTLKKPLARGATNGRPRRAPRAAVTAVRRERR